MQGQRDGATSMYSIRRDKWTEGPTMVVPRANHSCCILSNMLYAVAGNNEDGNLKSIEKLDVSKSKKKGIESHWQLV